MKPCDGEWANARRMGQCVECAIWRQKRTAPSGSTATMTATKHRRCEHVLNDTRQCVNIGVGAARNQTNASGTPRLRNVQFENMHCAHGNDYSYNLVGLPEMPIENLVFRNVTMGPVVKPQAECENVRCTCDHLTQPAMHAVLSKGTASKPGC